MARVIAFPLERVRPRPPRLLTALAHEEAETQASQALVAYSSLIAGSFVMLLQVLSLSVH